MNEWSTCVCVHIKLGDIISKWSVKTCNIFCLKCYCCVCVYKVENMGQ